MLILVLSGLLRPLDIIHPYRLEMNCRLTIPDAGAKNLYEYWGDTLSTALLDERPRVVVNLASDEYFRALRPMLTKRESVSKSALRVVTCSFRSNGRNCPGVLSKQHRGAMARHILRSMLDVDGANLFDDLIECMKTYSFMNYRFVRLEESSTTDVATVETVVFDNCACADSSSSKKKRKKTERDRAVTGDDGDVDTNASEQPIQRKRR